MTCNIQSEYSVLAHRSYAKICFPSSHQICLWHLLQTNSVILALNKKARFLPGIYDVCTLPKLKTFIKAKEASAFSLLWWNVFLVSVWVASKTCYNWLELLRTVWSSYSWKSGRVDVSQSICCKLNPSCEIFQLVSELAKVLVEAAWHQCDQIKIAKCL